MACYHAAVCSVSKGETLRALGKTALNLKHVSKLLRERIMRRKNTWVRIDERGPERWTREMPQAEHLLLSRKT